ncbi:MAG: glycosyltransferase family 39 protein [Chloroflexota bacterium]
MRDDKSKIQNPKSKMDWLWLALIGLAVQGLWAWRLTRPTYLDAYYYATNGRRLAAGYGFTEEVIWQFLDEPAGLPTPSHTYWTPLPSLLAAAGYKLSGGFRGAQLPFWLLAGLLPLLAYTISHQLAGERWQAWTAALLTAAGGYYSPLWNQPETFAPFAWAGGLCLLALAWASTGQHGYYWLAAGLTAGLAHLTRADGALLLIVGLAVWLVASGRWQVAKSQSKIQNPKSKILWLLGGYLLIMAPWFWRNWIVLGRLLPTAGAQTLFLTTYDDIFAYGRSLTLDSFLAWGWGNILRSRLNGLWTAVQTFVAVNGLIFLTPFILWGWAGGKGAGEQGNRWQVASGRWQSQSKIQNPKSKIQKGFLRPLTWYSLALFLTMSLLFTFPGERGGLFHSSVALWPWFMALAALGLSRAVEWTAARRPHWRPQRARRNFAALFVGIAFVLSAALGLSRQSNEGQVTAYTRIGALLPADAVVMVGDAPAFHYHTGLAAVSLPNEPPHILLEAADRYGVGYLILDEDHPRLLTGLYSGNEQVAAVHFWQEFDGVKLYRLAVGRAFSLPYRAS